ncbi:MAG TPA: hypothetical protein VFB89_05915 [Gemmatimonadales bacterium]|nr:hypothetical protein [Gemmatimonadales bacterium]
MTLSDPLPKGWFGTDLGPFRASSGTYELYPADSTASRLEFDGTFGWLPTRREAGIEYMVPVSAETALAVSKAPGLPPSFVSFMRRPDLTGAIPTCTSCHWNLVESAIPSPLDDGARLLGFMNDQQDVLLWYLYLEPDGGHRVVCGSIPYHDVTVESGRAAADLVEVAPNFEAFIYRFWVENLAWYELNEFGRADTELTAAVREYLARYPTAPGSG